MSRHVKAPETVASRSRARPSEPRKAVTLSVIVVVSERPEPLDDFYREYAPHVAGTGRGFEFLFVTEPWGSDLTASLEPLIEAGEPIRVLETRRTNAETELMELGVSECRGGIVLTLPAYHRVEPEALPGLIDAVEAGADVAVAARHPRKDPLINRLQSRVFHALVGVASNRRLRDIASGVRALRREVVDDLPMYGDFLRFLPLLAQRAGFEVVEVACPQHPRDQQPRVYTPGVYLRRLIDVMGIGFLLRFTFKPLRFFGLVGSALAVPGGLILFYLFIERVTGTGIAGRPLLLLGVLLLTLGVQVTALGLIGELIVHLGAPRTTRYRLRGGPEDR